MSTSCPGPERLFVFPVSAHTGRLQIRILLPRGHPQTTAHGSRAACERKRVARMYLGKTRFVTRPSSSQWMPRNSITSPARPLPPSSSSHTLGYETAAPVNVPACLGVPARPRHLHTTTKSHAWSSARSRLMAALVEPNQPKRYYWALAECGLTFVGLQVALLVTW